MNNPTTNHPAPVKADRTAELRAEVERLRADARRYRWLRDVAATTTDSEPVVCSSTPNDRECLFGAGLDAAIDAAMEASNAG